MDEATIRRGFIQLRDLCDPRGHELLNAIELTLLDSLQAVDKLDAMFQIQRSVDTVDWQNNDRWSRKTPGLEVVR